jgi:hypothetical protein
MCPPGAMWVAYWSSSVGHVPTLARQALEQVPGAPGVYCDLKQVVIHIVYLHTNGYWVKAPWLCDAHYHWMQALKSATEEYARVVDIVSRYAIFRQGVAFSCKRQVRRRNFGTSWIRNGSGS